MAISGKPLADGDVRRIFELRRRGSSVRDTARELALDKATVQRVAPKGLVERQDGLLVVLRAREQRRLAMAAKRKKIRNAR